MPGFHFDVSQVEARRKAEWFVRVRFLFNSRGGWFKSDNLGAVNRPTLALILKFGFGSPGNSLTVPVLVADILLDRCRRGDSSFSSSHPDSCIQELRLYSHAMSLAIR